MSSSKLLLIFFLTITTRSLLYGIIPGDTESVCFNINIQDTLKENQILYNGRVWRNIYSSVKEDQFLFSKEFLTGTLSINGKSFKKLRIRYDIYNDEIMIPTNHGIILQLNKQMIDSFSIDFENKTFKFSKEPADTMKGLNGYVNVLYKGKSSLYVKYRKEIELLGIDKTYDLFYQNHRIYLVKDSVVYPLNGKHDLLKALSEDKVQIRDFIKKNKLKVLKSVPESFIPVIRYYDSISQ